MFNEILSYLTGNLYLSTWLIGIILAYVIGWAVTTEHITQKYGITGMLVGGSFALSWMVLGGILLVFLWALFTISEFFFIPLVILVAFIVVIIVIAWAIKKILTS